MLIKETPKLKNGQSNRFTREYVWLILRVGQQLAFLDSGRLTFDWPLLLIIANIEDLSKS